MNSWSRNCLKFISGTNALAFNYWVELILVKSSHFVLTRLINVGDSCNPWEHENKTPVRCAYLALWCSFRSLLRTHTKHKLVMHVVEVFVIIANGNELVCVAKVIIRYKKYQWKSSFLWVCILLSFCWLFIGYLFFFVFALFDFVSIKVPRSI